MRMTSIALLAFAALASPGCISYVNRAPMPEYEHQIVLRENDFQIDKTNLRSSHECWFLFGVIQPSRDMLVRKAAPPGAMGRVFGIVSTGFNIGAVVGPLLFGWLMDRGAPRAIFGAAVAFLTVSAVLALIEERRPLARR